MNKFALLAAAAFAPLLLVGPAHADLALATAKGRVQRRRGKNRGLGADAEADGLPERVQAKGVTFGRATFRVERGPLIGNDSGLSFARCGKKLQKATKSWLGM